MKSIFQSIAKLKHWEFWPLWLSGSPLVVFCIFFGIRARKLFFLTNVNPSIDNSALLMSSKMKILNQLNPETIPKSLLLPNNHLSSLELKAILKKAQLDFPLIAKPDIGERGLLVEKIDSLAQLHYYLSKNDIAYIIQEYINLPNEIGIFFYKDPDTDEIHLTSVCLKKFLSITGDGHSSFEQLLENHYHGKYQKERMKQIHQDKYHDVIPKDQNIVLEPIGNHCRGTEFQDGSHLINDDFIALIRYILKDQNNLAYGRFDIKYNNLDELKACQNFKVIELNGSASEPTHIYDRKFSIFDKYRIFYKHFQIMFRISQKQSQLGHKPLSILDVFKLIHVYRKYIKGIDQNVTIA